MTPLARFQHRCTDQFEIGKVYRLIQDEERSMASHRHYFACIHEGWLNLPENIARRFLNEDHLRAWCLIKAGWSNERDIVCDSINDAGTIGSFIGEREPYVVVVVDGRVVKVFSARSQSVRSMGKEAFQQSKQDVLDLIEAMIGLKQGSLMAQQPKRLTNQHEEST